MKRLLISLPLLICLIGSSFGFEISSPVLGKPAGWLSDLLPDRATSAAPNQAAPQPLAIYEFDKSTLAECGWVEQFRGGFNGNPAGDASLRASVGSSIPSSKDQTGIAVTVDPGEVTFLNASSAISTGGRPLLLRMAVRASGGAAQVALVALKGDLAKGTVDGSIATHIPASAAQFLNAERRLTLVYEPDTGESITPALQVAATGNAGPVTIWIDRLDVIRLDVQAGYSGAEFASTAQGGAANPTSTPPPVILPTATPATMPTATPTPIPPVTPTPLSGIVTEQEPNDSQPQSLGAVTIGKTIELQGNLKSGGLSNEKYIGDPDIFTFELSQAADVSLALDWTGSADVDVYVLMQGRILGGDNQAGKPVQVSGTMGPGVYTLLVVSKNQAADYRFTLRGSAPTRPVYDNNVALLNGKFTYYSGSGLIWWYVFDGRGNYEAWSWSVVHGNIPTSYGKYEIMYPFILLHHDDKTDVYTLEITNNNSIVIDNQRYNRE